jgi:VanZ like family/Concanavalin A-like lectin/glucanases superfamily
MKTFISSFFSYPLRYFLCFVFIILLLTLWPFDFNLQNNISWIPEGGLRMSSPSTAYTQSLPQPLQNLSHFTILLHCSQDELSKRLAFIFSSSYTDIEQNFSLCEINDFLSFEIDFPAKNQRRVLWVKNAFKNKKPIWIAITFNKEKLRFYVDGEKKNEVSTSRLDLSLWNPHYPLVVGSEGNGYSPWSGTVYSIAIFDTVFKKNVFNSPDSLIAAFRPTLLYTFDRPSDVVRSTGKDSTSQLIIPAKFIPAKRTILAEPYTYWARKRIYLFDIVSNIIAFTPIGFFGSLYGSRRIKNGWYVAAIVILFGMSLSISVEYTQAFLPGRYSAIADVITNTIGTALGTLIKGVLGKSLFRFSRMKSVTRSTPIG